MELGDQWVLLGGLRYDGVDFDERTNQRGSYRTHDRSDGSLSPRLGVVYKPGGGLSLYSSYSRSFRPKSGEKILDEPEGDATPITPDMVGPVDPESAAQLEVGGRWTDADNRLSANWTELTAVNATMAEVPLPEVVSFSKLVLDLHTGKALFGPEGEWIYVDALSIAVLALAITGFIIRPAYVKLRTYRRKSRVEQA